MIVDLGFERSTNALTPLESLQVMFHLLQPTGHGEQKLVTLTSLHTHLSLINHISTDEHNIE